MLKPTCSCSSSGSVRAALREMSSALSTVVLAGSRRTSSGKRVAVTTTASSWAKQREKHTPASRPETARSMENLPGVIPDASAIEKDFQAGLRTHES